MAEASGRALSGLAARPEWQAFGSLAVVALALQAGGAPLRTALRFDREAVMHGELWRLFTAHFVHLGWMHLALNLAGLALCVLLAPEPFRPLRAFWTRLAVLAAGTGCLLWGGAPEVGNYVGLSGVLYGLFALGLLPLARRDAVSAACLALIAVRLVWPWIAGPSEEEQRLIGGVVVDKAHLFGVAVATAMLAVRTLSRKR